MSTERTWRFYFTIDSTNKDKAKCNKCNQMIVRKGGSTSGMNRHLNIQHGIDLVTKNNKFDAPSTSLPGTSDKSISVNQNSILKYIKKKTLEEILAKLAAVDGISINVISKSTFIRESISAKGYFLPKNPSHIMNLIFNYYAEIKSELKCKFSTILKANQKFCLALDEWTSSRNRRYMNINVMCNDGIFENLGLVRIEGSCGAEKTLDIVNERLKEFNLNLSTDIIAIITDGAAVMVKFGKLAPAFHLQCYTHGIHLAVLDTLFGSAKTELLLVKNQKQQVDQLLDDDSDIEGIESDDDGLDKEENPEFEGMSYEHDTNICDLKFNELKPQIQDAIKQICKISSFFRKSPVRNTILQQNVKLECGKELNLLLDCTTRWNSLLDMLERFEQIRIPIKKSLCEINATHLLDNEDQLFHIVKALIACLRPVKLASEALCRRDIDLIKSEGILSFVIETLNALDNSISRELLQNFKLRMITRRPKILISLVKYLHNPDLLYSKQDDNFFEMSSKSEMIKLSKELLHRLFPVYIIEDTVELENEDSVLISDTEINIESEMPANVLKRKLESAINMSTKKQNTGDKEYKTLLTEFNLFKASGKLTKNLKILLDALLCIKPTSVESERVFSTAGLFVNKLRTRLNDKSVNALVCLRTHFKNCADK